MIKFTSAAEAKLVAAISECLGKFTLTLEESGAWLDSGSTAWLKARRLST